MGAIRQAAPAAVEALDMHPVMFETGAASDEASRRTLPDRVAGSGALILRSARSTASRSRGNRWWIECFARLLERDRVTRSFLDGR